MQRGTNPLSAGQAVVTNQFTGAEFESGAVHRRAGVNEPQPGVEPEPAGLADEGGGWRGGQQNFSVRTFLQCSTFSCIVVLGFAALPPIRLRMSVCVLVAVSSARAVTYTIVC